MPRVTKDLRLLPYLVFFVSLILSGCAKHTSETVLEINKNSQNNTLPDTVGAADGLGAQSLQKKEGPCNFPIIGNFPSANKEFSSMQEAVNAPDAVDYGVIFISAADFDEDVKHDRDVTLKLSGGWSCDYADNPSESTVNSLTIKNGTFIVNNIVIR